MDLPSLQIPPGDVEPDRESIATASDVDARELEVMFEADAVHRRKSSLVDTPKPPRPRRPSCFVHSLLEAQQTHSGRSSPNQAAVQSLQKADKVPELPAGGNGAIDVATAHSRLLSKKQLSDMAFGIRELAKKLAHIRLKLQVKNVFILTKAHDEDLIKYTRQMTVWLLRNGEYNIYVENTLEHNGLFDAKSIHAEDSSHSTRLKYWTNELCKKRPQTFDIVLSLGGDGTVLYASWLFQRIVPPVISFAMGSLGFLTKFDFDKYADTLTTAFDSGITVSLRLRFEATVMRSQSRTAGQDMRDLTEELVGEEYEDDHTHRPDGTHNILNDVVLDRGPNATMSTLEIFGDDSHFTSVQADGVCVATPTGSTAYSLAAGGSLCHPDNPVILLTAICAHTLSFRPIILPDTMVLRIGVPYDARASAWASFDGRERVELAPGDYVTISASRFPFPSVLPQKAGSEDWIDSISRTLNWNSRQRQKGFKEWKRNEGKEEAAE